MNGNTSVTILFSSTSTTKTLSKVRLALPFYLQNPIFVKLIAYVN